MAMLRAWFGNAQHFFDMQYSKLADITPVDYVRFYIYVSLLYILYLFSLTSGPAICRRIVAYVHYVTQFHICA